MAPCCVGGNNERPEHASRRVGHYRAGFGLRNTAAACATTAARCAGATTTMARPRLPAGATFTTLARAAFTAAACAATAACCAGATTAPARTRLPAGADIRRVGGGRLSQLRAAAAMAACYAGASTPTRTNKRTGAASFSRVGGRASSHSLRPAAATARRAVLGQQPANGDDHGASGSDVHRSWSAGEQPQLRPAQLTAACCAGASTTAAKPRYRRE